METPGSVQAGTFGAGVEEDSSLTAVLFCFAQFWEVLKSNESGCKMLDWKTSMWRASTGERSTSQSCCDTGSPVHMLSFQIVQLRQGV